jgi:manganese/iron transport system ATP-binding protein
VSESMRAPVGQDVAEDATIRLASVSVRYRVPRERMASIKEYAIRWIQRRVQYVDFWALEEIDLAVERGEIFGVVGPNGAGKSTLFKVIAGILAPTQGEVKISGYGPGGHICIAYLPQRSQVDWNFPVNVSDVVMMGRIGKLGPLRWPGKKDWGVVRSALAEVDLSELAARQIGELSGGQQQRMFIARALAQEAELVLMDEPLTGLDANSQQAILVILDDLKGRGVTVMVSTHDLNQAAGLFDRVMLLNRRLVGFGAAAEVFTAERLAQAYGGQLRLVQNGSEVLAMTDTCCHDEAEG